MATIIANGCFDVFHEGHSIFLKTAKFLGAGQWRNEQTFVDTLTRSHPNRLIVAVNSDEYARSLKFKKWGDKYPIDGLPTRISNVAKFADYVVSFDTEQQLHELIEFNMPCILVKGPDYAGTRVTGDDIAPVIILDTPEPEAVKKMKLEVYGKL